MSICPRTIKRKRGSEGTSARSALIAEIGDKTQLATMLFSAEGRTSRWTIFAASAAALVIAAAIGVLAGAQLARVIKPQTLRLIAGAAFVAIGLWTMWMR